MSRIVAEALENSDPVIIGMKRELDRLRTQNAALIEALMHGQSLATQLMTEKVGGRNLPSWMLEMIRGFEEEASAAIATAAEGETA